MGSEVKTKRGLGPPKASQQSLQSTRLSPALCLTGGEGRAYSGLRCCSMYCFRIDNSAPPHVMIQYERDQNTGLR